MADVACGVLEKNGLRCWMAPRDITPGLRWGECIIRALDECPTMALLLTANSASSKHVAKEVERAIHKGTIVIPLRLEEVTPDSNLEYFLSDTHWMDALTPPLEGHLSRMSETILGILQSNREQTTRVKKTRPASADNRETFINSFEEHAVDEWNRVPSKGWLSKLRALFEDK